MSGHSDISLAIAGVSDRSDIVDPFCNFLLLSTPPADKMAIFLYEFSRDSILNAYQRVTNFTLDLANFPT